MVAQSYSLMWSYPRSRGAIYPELETMSDCVGLWSINVNALTEKNLYSHKSLLSRKTWLCCKSEELSADNQSRNQLSIHSFQDGFFMLKLKRSCEQQISSSIFDLYFCICAIFLLLLLCNDLIFGTHKTIVESRFVVKISATPVLLLLSVCCCCCTAAVSVT